MYVQWLAKLNSPISGMPQIIISLTHDLMQYTKSVAMTDIVDDKNYVITTWMTLTHLDHVGGPGVESDRPHFGDAHATVDPGTVDTQKHTKVH